MLFPLLFTLLAPLLKPLVIKSPRAALVVAIAMTTNISMAMAHDGPCHVLAHTPTPALAPTRIHSITPARYSHSYSYSYSASL